MQKRVLSLALAIVLIICAFATLSACGRKLKDREIAEEEAKRRQESW